MSELLEDFERRIAIAGYRVRVGDPEALLRSLRASKVRVQVFDASLIAGREHLLMASINALKAFKDGLNVSKNELMELLLYASAQRQIGKAVGLLGVKKESKSLATVVLGDSREETEKALGELERLLGGERDDDVLKLTADKIEGIKKAFGITSLELESKKGLPADEAITELVIERCALLLADLGG